MSSHVLIIKVYSLFILEKVRRDRNRFGQFDLTDMVAYFDNSAIVFSLCDFHHQLKETPAGSDFADGSAYLSEMFVRDDNPLPDIETAAHPVSSIDIISQPVMSQSWVIVRIRKILPAHASPEASVWSVQQIRSFRHRPDCRAGAIEET